MPKTKKPGGTKTERKRDKASAKKPSASGRGLAQGAGRPKSRPSAAERLQRREKRRQTRRAYVATPTPTGVSATEERQAQLEALSSKLESLQRAAALTDIFEELEEVDSVLATLPVDVKALRSRGYVFRSYLERKVAVLVEQWAQMRERVAEEVQRRASDLASDLDRAERAVQMAHSGDAGQIAQAQSALRLLEGKVSATQDALEAMYDTLDQNIIQAQAQVEAIEWALDEADQASFGFHPEENLVAACRAQLLEDGKDGPEGILFLTDARLVFERKEEVATKKFLFITTEREIVQEPVFAVPIGHIEEVKTRQAGFLGRKEVLELHFAPEADLSEAHLRLLGGADNEEWAGLIGRVRSGEIDRERVQTEAAPKKAIEARSAPTKCPNCGALITTPIVKGMHEVTCEYCGTVIRF